MIMKQVSRYHPLLVALHWVLAVLIIGALAIGFFWLAVTPNTDPRKIDVLRIHMAGGMLIFALMLVRFIVRMATARPQAATTGGPTIDRIARITHYGFYFLVLLMVATGYVTGLLAGLPAIVFGRSGAQLPSDFAIYPTFLAHGTIAGLLTGLIALHVLAALYHQAILKDRLFGRVAFGRRD